MLDNGKVERITVAMIDEGMCDIPRGEICWMSTGFCCTAGSIGRKNSSTVGTVFAKNDLVEAKECRERM